MTASQAANQLISIIKRRREEEGEGAELGELKTHTHTYFLFSSKGLEPLIPGPSSNYV